MAEKTWTVKTKSPLINMDSEIYGTCRHESKFHIFLATCECTDKHWGCENSKYPIVVKITKRP